MNINADQLRRKSDKYNKWFEVIHRRDLQYKFAQGSGNCCWELRERKHGGRSFQISAARGDTNGWVIRKVILIGCELEVNANIPCEGQSCVPRSKVLTNPASYATKHNNKDPPTEARVAMDSGIKYTENIQIYAMLVVSIYLFR